MKNIFLIFLGCSFFATTTAQTEIGGIILPNTESFKEHRLVLNGAGIREKFWINMYVGGLYLPSKSSDAVAIMNNDKPIAIKLHIVSSLISSERMSNAIDDGFQKSTQGNSAPFSEKIAQLKEFFSEEIEDNDVFDFLYIPKTGLLVYKNEKKMGMIPGENFKNAFFGIWLSDHPANEDLKKAMLGK